MNFIKKSLFLGVLLFFGATKTSAPADANTPVTKANTLDDIAKYGQRLKASKLVLDLLKKIPKIRDMGWIVDAEKYAFNPGIALGNIMANVVADKNRVANTVAEARAFTVVARCARQPDSKLQEKGTVINQVCNAPAKPNMAAIGCSDHRSCVVRGLSIFIKVLDEYSITITSPTTGIVARFSDVILHPQIKTDMQVIDDALQRSIALFKRLKLKKAGAASSKTPGTGTVSADTTLPAVPQDTYAAGSSDTTEIYKVVVQYLFDPRTQADGELTGLAIAFDKPVQAERLRELGRFLVSGLKAAIDIESFVNSDLNKLKALGRKLAQALNASTSDEVKAANLFEIIAEVYTLTTGRLIVAEAPSSTKDQKAYDGGALFNVLSIFELLPEKIIAAPVKKIFTDAKLDVIAFGNLISSGVDFAKEMATELRAMNDPNIIKTLPAPEQARIKEILETSPVVVTTEDVPF